MRHDSSEASPLPTPHSDRRALYLRWRPGRFADVLGQEHVTRTLRNAVATGQVAHGYLFCGPRGTGKTSIARILFKAINCEAPQDGDACDACAGCGETAAGRALDLIEIDAASNRGIDHIRELRERVWIAPSQARRKMYILDEAHQLSGPAWDAFLKTLEEPPPHVVFVLATTEVHKVPATILSRCQRFDLSRIQLGALVSHLGHVLAAEGLRAELAVLQRVARLSGGSVRDALSTLDQLVAYGGDAISLGAAREVLGLTTEEVLREGIEALARRDARAVLALVESLVREGADLRQFLDDLLAYLRALLLARLGASEALEFEFGPEEQAWLQSQAGAWEATRLVGTVRRLSAVDLRGRDASQFQIQIELALLEVALGVGAESVEPVASFAPASLLDNGLERRAAPIAVPAVPVAPLQKGASAVVRAAADEGGELERGVVRDSSPADPGPVAGPAMVPPDGVVGTTEPTSSAAAAVPPLDLGVVRQRWTELKEAIAAQDSRAGIALEAARVVEVQGTELHLAFTHEILQRTIEGDPARRAAVEQVLADQLGVACRLRCVPAEAWQPTLLGDEFLRQAAELFGATAVEPVENEASAGKESEP